MLPRLAALDARITRFRRGALGELAWIALIAAAVLVQVLAVRHAIVDAGQTDFAQFTGNARAWLAGNPYPAGTHDPNAPHVILLFAPFVSLRLETALAIWLALSYGCACLSLHVVAREVRVPLRSQMGALAAAVFFLAGAAADVPATGNMVWPLWLFFTLAWAWQRRGRTTASGALLGALMTAKPFLGLWVLWCLLRRDWRALAAVTAGAVVTAVAGVAFTGLAAWRAWWDVLHRITWYDERFNASIMGAIARVSAPHLPVWGLAAAVVAVTTVWRLMRTGRAADEIDRAWLLLVLSALLIAPLGWRYYLCLAWGPAIAWLAARPLGPLVTSALLVLWLCPVFRFDGHGPLYRATVASLVAWALVAAWWAVSWVDGPDVAAREGVVTQGWGKNRANL
jgi:hypothetical protein